MKRPITGTSLTGSFHSDALGRVMPFTAFLPPDYEAAQERRFPVLYLLHGGASRHDEWPGQMPLDQLLSQYPMIVFMPEGEHGLYLNGHNGQRYEDYVVADLPRFVESSFRALPESSARAMGGLSMGGFGSLNLGLKHPGRYAALASMSGALGMTWWNLGKREGSPYLPVLGPVGSPQRQAYDPWRILDGALAEKELPLPALWLDVGAQDDPDVVEANRNYHRSLDAAGVAHSYHERPGGHDWEYWRRATPDLLAFVAARLRI
jgi:S-formylglutathione hydrolase